MKKLLLGLCAIFAVGVGSAFGQCTPDPQYTVAGVYPDTTQGLPNGVVGVPYSEVITVVVPADTTVEIIPGFPQTFAIDSIVVDGLTGLPPGFTYECSDPNCSFAGGTSGCLIITGTVAALADSGNYPLDFTLIGYGSGLSFPATVNAYDIYIQGMATGVEELASNGFDLAQNTPNPFSNKTRISFDSKASDQYTLTVVNLLGKQVLQRTINASAGNNQVEINAADLSAGIYLYSLSNGVNTLTKRMVVNR